MSCDKCGKVFSTLVFSDFEVFGNSDGRLNSDVSWESDI